jgi:hypothetical protein
MIATGPNSRFMYPDAPDAETTAALIADLSHYGHGFIVGEREKM